MQHCTCLPSNCSLYTYSVRQLFAAAKAAQEFPSHNGQVAKEKCWMYFPSEEEEGVSLGIWTLARLLKDSGAVPAPIMNMQEDRIHWLSFCIFCIN